MNDLLLINGSPRGAASESLALAETVVAAARAQDAALRADRLDLVDDELPAFGADAALAKMDVIAGREVPAERLRAWDDALGLARRLTASGAWILGVPMWNGGLPWPLKRLIDTVTQPGVAFGFDPDAGYHGLLGGTRAIAIYTSQVYAPGVTPAFGIDHHSTYLRSWLDLIGVELVEEIRLQPTHPGDPSLPERRASAIAQAKAAGRTLGDRGVVA